jgi:hypothetical protein
MRAMKLVKIVETSEEIEVCLTTYIQTVNLIDDNIAQCRTFQYPKSRHIWKNDRPAKPVIPDWFTTPTLQRYVVLRFRRARPIRCDWIKPNETVLKFVKCGGMPAIYDGQFYFKRLTMFQRLKRIKFNANPWAFGKGELVFRCSIQPIVDRGIDGEDDQSYPLKTILLYFKGCAAFALGVILIGWGWWHVCFDVSWKGDVGVFVTLLGGRPSRPSPRTGFFLVLSSTAHGSAQDVFYRAAISPYGPWGLRILVSISVQSPIRGEPTRTIDPGLFG